MLICLRRDIFLSVLLATPSWTKRVVHESAAYMFRLQKGAIDDQV